METQPQLQDMYQEFNNDFKQYSFNMFKDVQLPIDSIGDKYFPQSLLLKELDGMKVKCNTMYIQNLKQFHLQG